MLPHDLEQRLLSQLQSRQLPGQRAQRRFSPSHSYGRHFGPPSHDARPAAVMLMIYYARGEWWMPLTLRPADMLDHAGQVCLPGGSLDPGESTAVAALRELHEEIGVPSDGLRLIGELTSLYLYNSNYLITPCLAISDSEPEYQVNEREVSQLITLPLRALLEHDRRKTTTIERRGVSITAPYWCWQQYCIWGGTAMILGEFSTILQACTSPSDETRVYRYT